MKKLRSVSMFIAAIMILASCNSSVSIAKRKYNSGYYVSVSKHPHANEKVSPVVSKPSVALVTVVEDQTVTASVENVAETNSAPIETVSANNTTVKNVAQKQHIKNNIKVADKLIGKIADKQQKRAAKKLINHFKNSGTEHSTDDVSLVLLVILCFLLPPVAVFLHEGGINNKFWISLLLTIFFFIPGIIYALYVVLS